MSLRPNFSLPDWVSGSRRLISAHLDESRTYQASPNLVPDNFRLISFHLGESETNLVFPTGV